VEERFEGGFAGKDDGAYGAFINAGGFGSISTGELTGERHT